MTRKKKKPVKKYKFELTLPAMGGIAVVCFCIFLWMFLLGIWTGQTLLMPVAMKTESNVTTESDVTVEKKQEEVQFFSEQKKRKPE